jgi:hypothetical protein
MADHYICAISDARVGQASRVDQRICDQISIVVVTDRGLDLPPQRRGSHDLRVALAYNTDEWDAFTKGTADGQFDRV